MVECGGLENRYVGNPGVGGSNPPLSAIVSARRLPSVVGLSARRFAPCQQVRFSAALVKGAAETRPAKRDRA